MKPSEYLCDDRVPYGAETPLGWPVTNWVPGDQKVTAPSNAFKVYERCVDEDEDLRRLVVAQSEIETFGVGKFANPTRSIEDKRALALMEWTTVKIEGQDAYVSGLLWREEHPTLPNNYDMAEQQ